jgi:aspartyl-tRNA(Asn)/glutamyl-tRNA(Gln) amidotransferase subunit B
VAENQSILSQYPEYEVVIGIEVHVQLTTKSKIFCSCPNEIAQSPNTNVCQICLGYPGVLPVFNQEVMRRAILAGLATSSTITPRSLFARKHYFYPDLPKGYQITQSDTPICTNGSIPIRLEDGSVKHIRLTRIHMEEDAGKNLHAAGGESFVDYNRAGTPLLEMVTEPDISSAYEAREYLKMLRLIVQYLGICTGNMEDGAFRGDTNISVRKKGDLKLGTKCELKNINSFKFISDAIEYEIERQITLLENGGRVKQETRLWDTKNRETIVMRSKEEAADYRYFQDPDLPIVEITPHQIEEIRAELPELPHEKFERFCREGLSPYEAGILVNDIDLAQYYEEVRVYTTSKHGINWILRNLMGYLKEHKIELGACNVTPKRLAQLVNLIDAGTINNNVAQEVFEEIACTGVDPAVYVKQKGLEQIGSADELEAIIIEIVAAHPSNVADYRAGKEKLFGFFVGQVMQKTAGKANPKMIQELLKKHLVG